MQLSGPVAAHLGYKTADGFVMKEKEPIFKKEFEMGVGGFGFGLNHQADLPLFLIKHQQRPLWCLVLQFGI
ncbi:MAG: hypothetical protein IPK46_12955 [Saprospiraceae bacterium]|nr:hypothetical protein [Saprospiraceae bacterium]